MADPAERGGGEGGFTLIELMIVIAIIAVIASIAIPNLLAAKLSANETAAIATLRNLNSAQVMVQGAGRIDTDNDSIGEFGYFLELAGRAGVRKGHTAANPSYSDFTKQGEPIRPAIVSQSLGVVDANGFVGKSGYAFMIFLPETSDPAKWVHETNTGTVDVPVAGISVTGQTGGGNAKIYTDLAENLWCCYAIPMTRGTSGNRCFFTNQSGDVLQSANDIAKHSGTITPMDGRSAFYGDGITSKVAMGTSGKDKDIWKITN